MFGLEYKNFEPDEMLTEYGDAWLHRLVDLAPFGSEVLDAYVEKSAAGYRVLVNFDYPEARFIADVEAPDCRMALDRAEMQISNQIRQWRKERQEQIRRDTEVA